MCASILILDAFRSNSHQAFKSPLEDFTTAVKEAGLATQLHYLRHGETYSFEVRVDKSL